AELRELARLGNARQHFGHRDLLAELRVERVVEAVGTDARDAAAGAEDVNARQDLRAHQGRRITLPKKSREASRRCASAAFARGKVLLSTGFSRPSATRPITVFSSLSVAFFEPITRICRRKNGMMSSGTTSPACPPAVTSTPSVFRQVRLFVKISPPTCS